MSWDSGDAYLAKLAAERAADLEYELRGLSAADLAAIAADEADVRAWREIEDTTTAITRVLYESIPNAPAADGDWEREKVVREMLGVWLESYCSGDYPMWILTTHEITVYRGDTKVIDFAALDAQRAAENWDEKLAHALSVLGLTPTQEKPSWLLASYWG